MSSSNEIDVVDVDNNITTKLKRLPNLKKWLQIEYEELRVQALEVVEETGIPYQYYEIQNIPTNRWVKVHNGLYNLITGVWRGYEEPSGVGKYKYMKNKLMNDLIPAFTDKYDKDV